MLNKIVVLDITESSNTYQKYLYFPSRFFNYFLLTFTQVKDLSELVRIESDLLCNALKRSDFPYI